LGPSLFTPTFRVCVYSRNLYALILVNNQLDVQFFFSYIFIPILYMFRTLLYSSSGESIVLIWHLVYVTLCRWPSNVQVWMETIRTCTLDGHLHRV